MSRSIDNPWPVWRDAAARTEIDRAIRGLYADLDAAVAERGPLCNASGRCCDFDAYGHRLYVTGLEIAWFLCGVRGSGYGGQGALDASHDEAVADRGEIRLHQLAPSPVPRTPNPEPGTPPPSACPYQIDGLCSTHTIRPLGCRVYFCEQGTEAWQQDTTERFLEQLKRLHTEHDLPYSYMEWRAGLAEAKRVLDDST
jgi:Fe-S-cluster containining protein